MVPSAQMLNKDETAAGSAYRVCCTEVVRVSLCLTWLHLQTCRMMSLKAAGVGTYKCVHMCMTAQWRPQGRPINLPISSLPSCICTAEHCAVSQVIAEHCQVCAPHCVGQNCMWFECADGVPGGIAYISMHVYVFCKPCLACEQLHA